MSKLEFSDANVLAVLRFLSDLQNGRVHGWNSSYATWFWSEDYKPANSVLSVMPEGTSPRRARAFMYKLHQRGLIDGCHCGCRGDYELSDKGFAYLKEHLSTGEKQ